MSFTPTDDEISIAAALSRRAGGYAELAPRSTLPLHFGPPHTTHMLGLPSGIGESAISHVSAARMSDMRYALCLASGDGGGGYSVVTVRLQTGVEDYGFPLEVFRTTETINSVQLLSPLDPVHNAAVGQSTGGLSGAYDGALIAVVWHGDSPLSTVRIFRTLDYGKSWTQIWITNGDGHYMEQPRALVNARSGSLYLCYYDRINDQLRALKTDDCLSGTIAWAWGPTAISATLASDASNEYYFDITQHPDYWTIVLSHMALSGGTWSESQRVGQLAGAGEVSSAWSWAPYTTVQSGVAHSALETRPRVIYAPTRPWICWSTSRVITAHRMSGSLYHSIWPLPIDGTSSPWGGQHVFRADLWQPYNWGFFTNWYAMNFSEYDTRLANADVWRSRLTPSTSVVYKTDNAGGRLPFSSTYVQIDNHGPDTDGPAHDQPTDDVGDNFAGFWTLSSERDSQAFPPKDGRDIDMELKFWFHKSAYHNIWLVVDDPAHPDTPIFKVDFYMGRDATAATHPHDTARGCRIWFCKRSTVPDHGVKNPSATKGQETLYFQHPLNYCFDGFDAASDNAAQSWAFRIRYVAADDKFYLEWDPAGIRSSQSYVPFVPYASSHPTDTREYVDVSDPIDAASDVYVASATEKYHTQPAGDLWPRRIYIGCPETKPAIEKQSGISVFELFSEYTNWSTIYNDTANWAFAAGHCELVARPTGGVDLFWVDSVNPDIVRRSCHGGDWIDAYTLQSFHSSWNADGGPDQAELTLLDVDNATRTSLYGADLRNYWVAAYARGGDWDRQSATLGRWGRWVCPFYGVSDTGIPTDTGSGTQITLRAFNPLRDATRSYKSQSFTALPPPEQLDPTTGDPVEPAVKDDKKVRESAVIYLTDFDAPADPLLNHFDDWVAHYAWETMLGLPAAYLSVPKVGLKPTNFTINAGGAESDLWDDIRGLWTQLGLTWLFDYYTHTLRAQKRLTIQGEAPGYADYQLNAWAAFATPFTRNEDDWGRAGSVMLTASNMEDRPNTAVARVAPWPDGAGITQGSVDIVNGLASQHATAEMYMKDLPLQALYKEWKGARAFTAEVHAWPYSAPWQKVWVQIDNVLASSSHRAFMLSRYASLHRVWVVDTVETRWDHQSLTQSVTYIDPVPFPLPTS